MKIDRGWVRHVIRKGDGMTPEKCGICGDTATHCPVGAEHDAYCCGCYGCDGTDSFDGAPCQPTGATA